MRNNSDDHMCNNSKMGRAPKHSEKTARKQQDTAKTTKIQTATACHRLHTPFIKHTQMPTPTMHPHPHRHPQPPRRPVLHPLPVPTHRPIRINTRTAQPRTPPPRAPFLVPILPADVLTLTPPIPRTPSSLAIPPARRPLPPHTPLLARGFGAHITLRELSKADPPRRRHSATRRRIRRSRFRLEQRARDEHPKIPRSQCRVHGETSQTRS